MRRYEKAIANRDDIDAVIRKCRVCRVAMVDRGRPYVIPLTFGYDGRSLYFHSAMQGRKLEILRRSPEVCFEFDRLIELERSEKPCAWGIRYQSVIGTGRASIIEDHAAKIDALAIIMRTTIAAFHTSEDADAEMVDHADATASQSFDFDMSKVERTLVIRVDIDEISGKQTP